MRAPLNKVRGALTEMPAGERGLTLVELLVAMALLLAVIGIAMPVLTQALQTEPKITNRATQVQTARVAMEKMARELRQGYAVTGASPSALTFRTYVRRTACGGSEVPDPSAPAIACQVTYFCTAGSCNRMEGPVGSGTGGTSSVLIDGLMSNSVFTYLPSPTSPSYVQVQLMMEGRDGDDAITLDDGVELRNAS